MNDIRRTLLWVVFSMSLVFLWDGWNKHNGQGSMFFPTPTAGAPASGAAPTSPGASALPVPSMRQSRLSIRTSDESWSTSSSEISPTTQS